ncbi:MAG: hypothetical protein UT39_C0002G0060 [Candidatus Woesebacteria bacterium GW2011_GWA1_39_21]|uniref:Uncharacterized protein n=1 Tax=Candidatus Woesebacteria bacterium GW2011_GWA1_39_21 TaxID=1618550 RepID=A0A0G0N6R5_9BACT|nr:MAG: hypothetical protein UT39_C0002G0060 [Candidatus Woesebacteria bacterium GW2011_GWA1_39_21]
MAKTTYPPIRISTGKEQEGLGVTLEAIIEDPNNLFNTPRAVSTETNKIKRVFIGSRYGGTPAENKKAVDGFLKVQEGQLGKAGIKVIAEIITPFEPGK